MEPQELQEHTEHAHHSGNKAVGLTTAIVAVLLAVATLLGHRAHTEETLLLTENVDTWDQYQAKHARAYLFALAAETQSLLPSGKEPALQNFKMSIDEECGSPAPKSCTSPLLKRSPLLQQLSAKPEQAESHGEEAPAAATVAAAPAEKHEEKHEKSAKEGGSKESGSKEGAVQIRERAEEGQKEVKLFERKADRYDGAELFLEVSIVLCSIALLAENKMYWKLSFISTAIGIVVAVWGILLR